MPPRMILVDQYPLWRSKKRQSPPRFRRNLDFTGAETPRFLLVSAAPGTRQSSSGLSVAIHGFRWFRMLRIPDCRSTLISRNRGCRQKGPGSLRGLLTQRGTSARHAFTSDHLHPKMRSKSGRPRRLFAFPRKSPAGYLGQHRCLTSFRLSYFRRERLAAR